MTTQSLYEIVTIPLQDGSTVDLRPASIKTLKAGQAAMAKLAEAEGTDATLDVLLDVCVTVLKKQRPDLADRDTAEELFDMDTIYKVIEVTLGVNLADPKLQEAAMRLMEQENSQTSAS